MDQSFTVAKICWERTQKRANPKLPPYGVLSGRVISSWTVVYVENRGAWKKEPATRGKFT